MKELARKTGAQKMPRAVAAAASGGKPPAPVGVGGVRKPHRWRAGTVALREIRKLQLSTDPVIPMAPFVRLVREIGQDIKDDLRFQAGALEALREAAEHFLVETFETTMDCAVLARHVTAMVKDMRTGLNILAKHSAPGYSGQGKTVPERLAMSVLARKSVVKRAKAAAAVAATAAAAAAAAAVDEPAPVSSKLPIIDDE